MTLRSYSSACPCAVGGSRRIAGYMGKSEVMDDAIASFAMTYAAQTAIDHAALVRAKTDQDGKLKLVAVS
jgi:Uncharacterized protein conserved in bacteria (DUF2252)